MKLHRKVLAAARHVMMMQEVDVNALFRIRGERRADGAASVSHVSDSPRFREKDAKEHLISVAVEDAKTDAPKIRVCGLELCTDAGTAVLRDVSVDIVAGQVVGIIGPSGSGKTSLLRAFNRLWEPAPGCLFLDGEDITSLDVTTIRRRVGMLFQSPTLFDGTVADNVRMGPSLRGKKLSDSEVEALLALADLDPSFAKKSVIGLSVGQAQRVALARTLANDPEVLLLDEPTSALDPNTTLNIEKSILTLQKQKGLTVIIVSHSLEQIQRVANVVCVLVAGQIVEVLNTENLFAATHPQAKEFLAASHKSHGM